METNTIQGAAAASTSETVGMQVPTTSWDAFLHRSNRPKYNFMNRLMMKPTHSSHHSRRYTSPTRVIAAQTVLLIQEQTNLTARTWPALGPKGLIVQHMEFRVGGCHATTGQVTVKHGNQQHSARNLPQWWSCCKHCSGRQRTPCSKSRKTSFPRAPQMACFLETPHMMSMQSARYATVCLRPGRKLLCTMQNTTKLHREKYWSLKAIEVKGKWG